MNDGGLKSFLYTSELPRSSGPSSSRDPGALAPLTAAGLPSPFALIERLDLKTRIQPGMRRTMSGLLHANLRYPNDAPQASLDSVAHEEDQRPASTPVRLEAVLPAFLGLKMRLLQDLETNLGRLLSLNMSRREAIAQHLDRLAGLAPLTGSAGESGEGDGAIRLRRWIEGPRSPAQNAALHAYLEEVALVVLGQAVLLKAWSDRGVRNWSEADLRDLNWTLNSALKPHLPLDRESWQVARQNIYSWYKPSSALQKEVWQRLAFWKIGQEGPLFLSAVLSAAKKASPDHRDAEGYDSRFLKAVWAHSLAAGFDPRAQQGPLRRPRGVFSPTLRDGSMVRAGPASLVWVGLETSPFQLMLCELMQLWWGITAPPLWAIGDGLEVHTRDQLSLALGSPKPSLVSRISEMEAFDAAFVLEERAVRAQGRAPEAQRFREQIESIPYFKKLRSPGTTLGDLQACVALSKLRPEGLLFWAREEPLDERDGGEILTFLLDRSKLVCEWDFSSLTHSLPSSRPLFPRHFYLFRREPRVEERLAHRPLRITLSGQLRSHIEVPQLFDDALGAMSRPASSSHGHWQVHALQSPTAQGDWANHWPDPASHQTLGFLERLRESSMPLASVTNIRHTPEGDPGRQNGWSVHPSLKGLWIQARGGVKPGSGVAREQRRQLIAHPLPKPGKLAQGGGFLVLVADETAIAPLKHFLESEAISLWLEYRCERRGDRWIITEPEARYIPVPRLLLRSLGLLPESVHADRDGVRVPPSAEESKEESPIFALPLPGEWERLITELTDHPERALKGVQALRNGGEARTEHAIHIMTEVFVRASRVLEHLLETQGPLLRLVSPAGKIRWRELLKILPRGELTQISLHSGVQLLGSLPLHLPVGQISLVKSPRPGILLATELGMSLRIVSDSSVLLDMLWDQLEGLSNPTWSELIPYLRLPRRIELAETTAADILRSHGTQTRKLAELAELLASCSLL